MNIQLLHQMRAVSIDGVRAQAEQVRYVFCRVQLRDELQKFPFPPGKKVVRIFDVMALQLP